MDLSSLLCLSYFSNSVKWILQFSFLRSFETRTFSFLEAREPFSKDTHWIQFFGGSPFSSLAIRLVMVSFFFFFLESLWVAHSQNIHFIMILMFKTSLIDSAYKLDFQCGLMWTSRFAPLTSFAPLPPPSRSAFRPRLLSFEFSRDFLGFVLPALSSQCPVLYVRLGQICYGNSSNIMAHPSLWAHSKWTEMEVNSQGHWFSVRGLGTDSDSPPPFPGHC